jgi:hypothetical protein
VLEFYESDLSVEADEDTEVEVGGDAWTGSETGGAAKSDARPGRRWRSSRLHRLLLQSPR